MRAPWIGFFVVAALLNSVTAHANLQVFPTRVLLTEQKKSSSLSMRHLGSKPERYRISAVFYRMEPSGAMQLVVSEKNEESSLVPYLRFTPRDIVLKPGEEQVLRLLLHSRSRLADGAYRAHVYFEPVENEEGASGAESVHDDSMQLRAKIAVAVPVIYQQGSLEASATLKNLELTREGKTPPAFSAELVRTGKGFLYGDLHAFFTKPGQQPVQVANVVGISSYIDSRIVRFALSVPEGLNLSDGTLSLEFRAPRSEGGRVLSRIEAAVPSQKSLH